MQLGLGNAYTDCLGACVEYSQGADPEGMAACVALCKENFPAAAVVARELIPGLPNQYLVLGAVGLVVAVLLMKR